ncbi:MAG: hypothetical protein HOP10_06135, partial [Chitinophagaceae bacterium]|nr:hypothetical protein [Chitinophagaceae bacterium]
MNSTLFDTRTELTRFISQDELNKSSALKILSKIFQEYLILLQSPLGKTESKIERDKILCTILSKYYGVDGKRYTKEDLSLLLDKTTERIRQLINGFIDLLKEVVADQSLEFKLKPEAAQKLNSVYNTILKFRVVSIKRFEYEVKKLIFVGDDDDDTLLNLLFDIYDIEIRSPHV